MTFNEFLPLPDFITWFTQFIDSDTFEKINNVFDADIVHGLSVNFRIENGSRTMSEDLINFCVEAELLPDTETGFTDSETFTEFSHTIARDLYFKWGKILDNFFAQIYEPLWNVDGSETETIEYQGTESESYSRSRTASEKASETSSSSNGSSSENSRSAFNADGFSPVDKTEENANGTAQASASGENSESESSSNSKSFNDRKNTRTLKRSGNIGVTSSQNLATQEIELRLKYDFQEIIFADLRKLFFEQIY